uniref:D-alanyl-D-alanine dipeptidase n=1 Tax=Candidatus Kentrum eta TaxID=2126337 RepID=A0A450V8U8_9GAMM|nr:MAG: D-alanyl-D-alanine dipeptidase [Candidatus Kentron sp. H]VFK02279.1 MAG: D-alanyl-D-alanine dipeptidase [Candidatus Kentron sp. H]VFK05388.1 MAG: D-alanyl-D-alanine dipeptidase [Candidatus Kentron sp. H]
MKMKGLIRLVPRVMDTSFDNRRQPMDSDGNHHRRNPACAALRLLVCCAVLINCPATGSAEPLPAGFVHVDTMIDGLAVDMRYFTTGNFVGERIDGYEGSRCILTEPAARALGAVQEKLRPLGLGLKVFDCYRPQRAVDHFARWAKAPETGATKAAFYPGVDKSDLFVQGCIVAQSSHSRGSAVDVTLMGGSSGGPDPDTGVDMGTRFDLFDRASWPDYGGLSFQQRANRLLLRLIMEKHGFLPYPKEWWHFRL